MSKPPAGRYVITSRIASPSGQLLAITFNGQDTPAIVTPFDPCTGPPANQIWQVVDFDANTQSISPVNIIGLQAALGDNVIIILPSANFTWIIRTSDSGTTIQDGDATVFWGLTAVVAGEPVGFAGGSPSFGQLWDLRAVN